MNRDILSLWAVHPNLILVLQLNTQGKILGVIRSGFNDMISWIAEQLESLADVRRAFVIPENIQLSGTSGQQVFPCRPDLFNFTGEGEEYHSLLSVINLALYPREEGGLYGCVRLTGTFARISPMLQMAPLFVADENEQITAFNRRFRNLHSRALLPSAILNTPLAAWLSSTPGEEVARLLKEFRLPDFQKSSEWDFSAGEVSTVGLRLPPSVEISGKALNWRTVTTADMYLELEAGLDWSREDFRLEIEVLGSDAGPPCLILGDPSEPGKVYSDSDGYLLGPSLEFSALLLKKGGLIQESRSVPQGLLQEGVITYLRCGNVFQILRNNVKLFETYDFSGLQREKTWAVLHMRPGRQCRLGRITLFRHLHESQELTRNFFVSLLSEPARYFLLTKLFRFEPGASQGVHTVYQLRDLSDIKATLDDLEETGRRKSASAAEANRKLKVFSQGAVSFASDNRAVQVLREKAERIAPSEATVLIEGETGTGKEVLAHFIHDLSLRRDGPFIKVDCSTLPQSLFESLLFGHEKGAFTGAESLHKGLLEQADKGTLFLDEAGNLTPEAQAKLLHFLQDRSLTRVGGVRPIRLDVRILVASNVPLFDLVKAGRFREDLYYRIAVVIFRLPALRQRMEDLPALINIFLSDLNKKYGRKVRGVSAEGFRSLYAHAWPGNIRELKNVVEQSFLLEEGDWIRTIILPGKDPGGYVSTAHGQKKQRAIPRFLDQEPDKVFEIIRDCRGNMRRSAEKCDVSVRALYYFLKKRGLRPNDLRKNPRRA